MDLNKFESKGWIGGYYRKWHYYEEFNKISYCGHAERTGKVPARSGLPENACSKCLKKLGL